MKNLSKKLTSLSLLFFISTCLFAEAIVAVKIISVNPNPIPCGDSAIVTVEVQYLNAQPEDGSNGSNHTVKILEFDGSPTTDDVLCEGTVFLDYKPSGGFLETKNIEFTIYCGDASPNCDFSGNAGTDDEHGIHSIYAKAYDSNSEKVEVTCVKEDGAIGFRSPNTVIDDPSSPFTLPVGMQNYPTTNNTIYDMYVVAGHPPGFSAYSVGFPPTTLESTGSSINNAMNRASFWQYDSGNGSSLSNGEIGSVQYTMEPDIHESFGQYLFTIIEATVYGEVPTGGGEAPQLNYGRGTTIVYYGPADSESPTIDQGSISYGKVESNLETLSTSVTGGAGAITDDNDSIMGYLEVAVYQRDSLNIGHTIVNPDGSFAVNLTREIDESMSLTIIARDGRGNEAKIETPATVSSIQDEVALFPFEEVRHFPNPASSELVINFNLTENSEVKITLFDNQGKQIEVICDRSFEGGVQQLTFDVSHLSTGVYFYQLSDGVQKQLHKLFVTR